MAPASLWPASTSICCARPGPSDSRNYLPGCLAANMVSARSSLSTIVLGLPRAPFFLLALSTTILPVADAFYIPQEFNIDAARNETDRRVVHSSCCWPRVTACAYLQFDDKGTLDVSGVLTPGPPRWPGETSGARGSWPQTPTTCGRQGRPCRFDGACVSPEM